jgi:hypothetical protein
MAGSAAHQRNSRQQDAVLVLSPTGNPRTGRRRRGCAFI